MRFWLRNPTSKQVVEKAKRKPYPQHEVAALQFNLRIGLSLDSATFRTSLK
jgi:hypothetical protein